MLAILIIKSTSFFAAAKTCPITNNKFFGFPHWWDYLGTKRDYLGDCQPVFNAPGDLWAVALAIIDMLLYLAGIIAVFSIIFAGISYITAAGSSDKVTAARKRIINSLIGLAIAVLATVIVDFVGKSIG
jgi:hypothetical protein